MFSIPNPSEPSKSNNHLSILLQFNATIIVGLLLLLTLSDTFLIPDPFEYPIYDITLPDYIISNPEFHNLTVDVLNHTVQQQIQKFENDLNNQRMADLNQALLLGYTSTTILPFIGSSILIIFMFIFEKAIEKERKANKKWWNNPEKLRIEKWPFIVTIFGSLYLIYFFTNLLQEMSSNIPHP